MLPDLSFFLFCRLVWTLFTIFTCVHLWANYSAVTSVIMETLNQARLHILVNDFFSRESVGLPSIKDTNFREPVIYSKLVWYDIERKNILDTLHNFLFSSWLIELRIIIQNFFVGATFCDSISLSVWHYTGDVCLLLRHIHKYK